MDGRKKSPHPLETWTTQEALKRALPVAVAGKGGGHQAQERGLTPCPPPPSVSTMILKQVPGAIVCVAALRMTECMELRMIFAFLGALKSSGLEELGKNIYKL